MTLRIKVQHTHRVVIDSRNGPTYVEVYKNAVLNVKKKKYNAFLFHILQSSSILHWVYIHLLPYFHGTTGFTVLFYDCQDCNALYVTRKRLWFSASDFVKLQSHRFCASCKQVAILSIWWKQKCLFKTVNMDPISACWFCHPFYCSIQLYLFVCLHF